MRCGMGSDFQQSILNKRKVILMSEDSPRVFVKVVLVAAVFVAVGLYFTAPMFYSGHSVDETRIKVMSSAKNIWEAWVNSSLRFDSERPPKGVHRAAAALAIQHKGVIEMKASDWAFPFDPLVQDCFGSPEEMPKNILQPVESLNRTIYIDRDFKRSPVSWEMAVGIPVDAPKDTPLMWTRGLKKDGTWSAENGVFGDKGGYVVFVDGRIRWFEKLSNKNGGELVKYGTREPTADIGEAVCGGIANIRKSAGTVALLD